MSRFDLDLSYITREIIAMGLPSSGMKVRLQVDEGDGDAPSLFSMHLHPLTPSPCILYSSLAL